MKPLRILAPLLALALVFCAGIWLGGHPSVLPNRVGEVFVDEDVHLQAEAVGAIEDNFYKNVPERRLRNGSLDGMVRSLRDRFSDYFDPAQNKLFQESTEGSFSGVGMVVRENERGLRVVSTFPGTPARRARIKTGDVILAVDGKSIAGEPSQVATARIKGPEGTDVTLTITRKGKRRTVTLKRASIDVPVVAGRMRESGGEKLGAIAVASFTKAVSEDVREQITRLQRRGAQGFVLDLRGNGGGLLVEAVLVSSLFIPKGTIVTTKGRTKPKQVFDAVGSTVTKKPVVVLVNKDTASASEIVAAALQQRYDSKVVGQRTFGKGVFGQVFPLSNDGALELTVGNYFTPNGSSINKRGIKPNVALSKSTNANPRLALDRALSVLAAAVRRDDKPAGGSGG